MTEPIPRMPDDVASTLIGSTGYEVYRERWEITAWKDGAVFQTRYLDEGWFDEADVKNNRPRQTNIQFVVVSSGTTPEGGLCIRRKPSVE